VINLNIRKDFSITLDDNEIIRLLQNKSTSKKQRTVPSSLLNEIEEAKVEAVPLINPSSIYGIFESKILMPRFLFGKSESTILAICTIGKELESLSRIYMKKGHLAQGVILDAIASHAAEQTAEFVHQEILKEFSNQFQGKEVTSRFSPGYCQWELDKGQKTIFALLDGSKIGVSLSTSSMMNPVKSVSYAINIGDEVDKELGVRGCENCDMVNCAFRRT
jgi:hypothetical protein